MIPEYCYECMNRQMQMKSGCQQPMEAQMPYLNQPNNIPMQQMPNFQQQHNVGQVQTQTPMQETTFPIAGGTPVETDINYTQAYLRTKIGSKVKIEFLIGTNMLVDRDGVLLEVGISYVVIREAETDDELLCDIYSIKFVRFYL